MSYITFVADIYHHVLTMYSCCWTPITALLSSMLPPYSDANPSPLPGTGFSSADLELSLPEDQSVAQVAWFGLCRDSDVTSVLASVVVLPQLVSRVPCNTTFVGELPTSPYGTAGRVYLLDRVTFAVLGFSYDGEAPGNVQEVL